MKTRSLTSLFVAMLLLTNASAAFAQKKPKAKRAASAAQGAVEPLRVINGEMSGRTVVGEFNANGRSANFTFTLAHAEIADGRLQLGGAFSLDNRISQELKAKLFGVIAQAATPWPNARESKDKSKKQVTEQTQSLYAQAEAATNCGTLFLRMELPPRLRAAMGAGSEPIQIGIVPALIDNQKSEEINRGICQVYKILSNKAGGGDLSASLERLNHSLSSPR